MPQLVPSRRYTIIGWLVAALYFIMLGLSAVWSVYARLFVGALLAGILVSGAIARRRNKRWAASRRAEDIGTFARAFDRRAPGFDAHVVRAVWDVLQPYVRFRNGAVPLRPTDRLDEDLNIDPDDLECDVIEAAKRVGRSLQATERNPSYARLNTVGDFVAFLCAQPRLVSA
jgi:hypothetical protein